MKRIFTVFWFCLFLTITQQGFGQIQVGQDIYDEEYRETKVDFSSNGNKMATVNYIAGQNKSLLKIYELYFDRWVQIGQDIPLMGYPIKISMSYDGNRVAVLSETNFGTIMLGKRFLQVYTLQSNNQWQKTGVGFEGSMLERFVNSISFSRDGKRMALGYIYKKKIGITQYKSLGYVKVYELQNEEWMQIGSDIVGAELLGEEIENGFGSSVSLSSTGIRLAIGSSNFISNKRFVVVYEFKNNDWVKLGSDIKADLSEGTVINSTGEFVHLSSDGNELVMLSTIMNTEGQTIEAIINYEYKREGWHQTAILKGTQSYSFDDISVSYDAKRILFTERFPIITSQQIKVVERGSSVWNVVLLISDTTNNYKPLKISKDGSKIAV